MYKYHKLAGVHINIGHIDNNSGLHKVTTSDRAEVITFLLKGYRELSIAPGLLTLGCILATMDKNL